VTEAAPTPAHVLVVDDEPALRRRLSRVLESRGMRVGVAELAELPYGEAKRRLVAMFDETYTAELLQKTGGNMSEAARRAGLDRSNFRRLCKRSKDEP